MVSIAIVLSLFNPLLFVVGVVLIALSMLADSQGIAGYVAAGTLLLAGPLAASCASSLLCRWGISKNEPGAATNLLAGLMTLGVLLSDPTALTGVFYVWLLPIPKLATYLLVFGQATAFACLGCAVVMGQVLIAEVPLRWSLATFGGAEHDSLIRVGRLLGVGVTLFATWYLIMECARMRLDVVLHGLIR